MKYLKRTDKSAAKELLDVLDLQKELLEKALSENSREQYATVKNTVSEFMDEVLTIGDDNFERFKRLIDLTSKEEEALFGTRSNEGDAFPFYKYLSTNHVIPFLVNFYMTGIFHAYKESDRLMFEFFVDDLLHLFRRVTSIKNLNQEKRTSIFGNEYLYQELRTQFVMKEVQSAYIEFTSKNNFVSQRTTDVQPSIKERLFFEIHQHYFLDQNFYIGIALDTLKFIHKGISEQIIELNDLPTFSYMCSRLYEIAEQHNQEYNDLRFSALDDNERSKFRSIIDKADTISTIRKFEEVKDQLSQIETGSQYEFVKRIRSFSEFSLKYTLLRSLFVQIGAELIKKGNTEMLYSLLFSRQPLEANYINSNNDFFPTGDKFGVVLLGYLDQVNNLMMTTIDRNTLTKEKDLFMILWLFRNYLWLRREGYSNPSFITQSIQGKDVYLIKQFVEGIWKYVEIKLQKNPLFFTFNERVSPEEFDEFIRWLQESTKLMEVNHQQKVKAAKPESTKVTELKTKTIEKINAERSLTNFFVKRQNKSFKISSQKIQNATIINRELYDKGPLINPDLPYLSSAGADDIYPEVMALNLSTKMDHYLLGKINERCDAYYLSTDEMNHLLSTTSFSGKVILSHYIHFGFEILRNKQNFKPSSNTNDKYLEGCFDDIDGKQTNIFSFSSYSSQRFLLVLNSEQLIDFIDTSDIYIEEREFNDDRMKIIFEAELSLIVKESNTTNRLGVIYYLR